MADKSEVYVWLKSLSSRNEIRETVPAVRKDHEDHWYTSNQRIWTRSFRLPISFYWWKDLFWGAELSCIKTESGLQFNLNHLEPKRLNMTPSTSSAPQQRSIQSPLDRRAAELLENLKLLEVQVESAKSHLQGKQKTPWNIDQMFMRGAEKCVLFAIRLATTEQIVRKFLVTMSTLVS